MRYIIVLQIFFLFSISLAQNKYETYFMFDVIETTKPNKKGESKVTFKIPRDFTVEKNQKITLFGRYNPINKDKHKVIGKGTITSIGEYSGTANIELYHPETPSLWAQPKDIVETIAKIPSSNYRSVFYYLERYKIRLAIADKKDTLSTFEFLYQDSRDVEERLAARLVRQVHQIPDSWENYNYEIKTGFYKGKKLLDVMRNASSSELISFLYYAKKYPLTYYGNCWYMFNVFGTWILDLGTFTTEGKLQMLADTNSVYTFEEMVNGFNLKTDTLKRTLWTDEIKRLYNNGRSRQALFLAERLISYGKIMKLPLYEAWGWFYMGHTASHIQQYKLMHESYKKATPLFLKHNSPADASYSLYNTGLAYKNLHDYDSAFHFYNECANLRASLPVHQYSYMPKAVASVNEEIADVLADKGDYIKSNEYRKKVVKYYQSIGDDAETASAIWEMAYNYGYNMSRHTEAIEQYKEAEKYFLKLNNLSSASTMRSNIAQEYWSLFKYEKAVENHQKALEIAIQGDIKDQIAYCNAKLMNLYSKLGRHKEAEVEMTKMLEQLKVINDDNEYAERYSDIGYMYTESRSHDKALKYYYLSKDYFQATNDISGEATTWQNIGLQYWYKADFDSAKICYNKNLNLLASIPDTLQMIGASIQLAKLARFKFDYEEAEKYFDQANRYSTNYNSKLNSMTIASERGGMYMNQGKYDLAKQQFDKMLELAIKYDYVDQIILAYTNLASLAIELSDIKTTGGYYKKALSLAQEHDRKLQVAQILTYISDMHRIEGDYEKAWEQNMKGIDAINEIGNDYSLASAYIGLGNIKNTLGEYKEAIKYYHSSDSIYTRLNNPFGRTTPLNNTGTIYFWQGSYPKSTQKFKEALQILESQGIYSAFYGMVLGNLGEVAQESGDNDSAKYWLDKAYSVSSKLNDRAMMATELRVMAFMHLETGQLQTALEKAKKSDAYNIELELKTPQILSSLALGRIKYELKKDTEAKKDLLRCIKISNDLNIDKVVWEAYYYLGLLAKRANDLAQSKEYFLKGVEVLEHIQSKIVGGEEAIKLFNKADTKSKLYEALTSVLIENGEAELAMKYISANNNQEVKNKYKQLDIQFKDSEKSAAVAKEKDLKSKIDRIDKMIADAKSSKEGVSEEKLKSLLETKTIAEQGYLKFVNTTIRSNPELSQHLSKSINPVELRTDKRMIPKDMAVVSYLPGDSSLYIFIATHDTVLAKVVKAKRKILERNIKYMHNVASHKLEGINTGPLTLERGAPEEKQHIDGSDFKKISEELFSMLIAPFIDEIKGKEKIAIVPTGKLHFLPFQMLGRQLKSGKFHFLIEDVALFYINSLRMLGRPGKDNNDLKILAFANADKSLPSTENEVNDIKNVYASTKVFIGSEATEDKVKKDNGEFNVLHFATHGNLDYYDFINSYLTLSKSKDATEDGKLTIEEVWEIENLHMYKMVTLSACQTAVAEGADAGWPISPANSFLDAGVPSVLASLWSVSDEATAKLMKYFYENLKSMEKVKALRMAQAKLSTQDGFHHPYYWAPFILIGDWR